MKHKTYTTQEELIVEWKRIRGYYFNVLNEDKTKFNKQFNSHPLYESVGNNFDKNFKEINQVAQSEIEKYMKEKQI